MLFRFSGLRGFEKTRCPGLTDDDAALFVGYCFGRAHLAKQMHSSLTQDEGVEISRDLLMALFAAGAPLGDVRTQAVSYCTLLVELLEEVELGKEQLFRQKARLDELVLLNFRIEGSSDLSARILGVVERLLGAEWPTDALGQEALVDLGSWRAALLGDPALLPEIPRALELARSSLAGPLIRRDGDACFARICEELDELQKRVTIAFGRKRPLFLERVQACRTFGWGLLYPGAHALAGALDLKLSDLPGRLSLFAEPLDDNPHAPKEDHG